MPRIQGTIHAERSNLKELRNYVRLYSRYWDGIERPDYVELKFLTADEARYLAQQLFSAAEKIDGKSKRDRTNAKIAKQLKKTVKEAKKRAEESGEGVPV